MDISNLIRAVLIRIFLAFLILSVIVSVMKEKFISWLYGRNFDSGMSVLTRGYVISDISTKRLVNNSVITSFQPSDSNMSGDPIRATVSSIKNIELYVLRDVPLDSFHDMLIGDHKDLRDYIVTNASEKHAVKPGSQDIFIHVDGHSLSDHTKRRKYSLVIGLISNASDLLVEEIQLCSHSCAALNLNITCYIIHVKIREEEQVNTSIMYSYWKTNWNRLLIPQILYDAGENTSSADECTIATLPVKTVTSYANNDPFCRTWKPCCFVCLSSKSTSDLRVLLPCRHAAICSECFKSLHNSAMFSVHHNLIGLLTCPLCRTPVNSTLLLPKTNEIDLKYNSNIDEDMIIGTKEISL
ncbi:zinc finger protein [Schistosoma japonicum]|nr:zinc finger protein [Schistosoma japonicum]KAH8855991.1 zinc finger protein [Schistosoma japonicum]